MEILRVFNNNIILARSAERGDMVLSGRGIGFRSHPGHGRLTGPAMRRIMAVECADMRHI